MISIYLNYRYLKLNRAVDYISLLVATVFLLLYIITPIMVAIYFLKKYDRFEDREFLRTYKFLFDKFDSTRTMPMLLHMTDMIKKFLFSLALVFSF